MPGLEVVIHHDKSVLGADADCEGSRNRPDFQLMLKKIHSVIHFRFLIQQLILKMFLLNFHIPLILLRATTTQIIFKLNRLYDI